MIVMILLLSFQKPCLGGIQTGKTTTSMAASLFFCLPIINNKANVVPNPRPNIPQSMNAMHTRVPVNEGAINFMFSSLQSYNRHLEDRGVGLRAGLTAEYGLGVFALHDFECDEVVAQDSCVVFAQDGCSYEVEPICPLCACMPTCGCGYMEDWHLKSPNRTQQFLELRKLDPRLLGAVDLAKAIRSMSDLQIFYRRRYTDIYPERRNCINRLSMLTSISAKDLDEIVGILRCDAVDVVVDSNRPPDPNLPRERLKHFWLSVGEIPTVGDLQDGRFPPLKGVALTGIGSMLNHHCVKPNVEFVWTVCEGAQNLTLEIVALENIRAGQQLLVCYNDEPDQLVRNFGFQCKCSACAILGTSQTVC